MNKIYKLFFMSAFLFIAMIAYTQSSYRQYLDVIHYHLSINLTEIDKDEINGVAEIKLTVNTNTAKPLKLDLLSPLIVDSIIVDKQKIAFTHKNIIEADKSIKSGDTIDIVVYYHGKPAKDERWGGFFIQSGYAFNYGVGMSAEPPVFGRCWFPCIDTFNDRATYSFDLTVSDLNTAVANGMLIEVLENKNNTKTFRWRLDKTIPTYLASVAAGSYVLVEDEFYSGKTEVPAQIYVNPINKKEAEKSLIYIEKAFNIFEDKFGKYQWPRVGYVSTPMYSGAMEHATNIAYPDICSAAACEMLLVHELAHFWFGDLVTCASEKDMWLNEGWASFLEQTYLEFSGSNHEAKNYARQRNFGVLTTAHINDKGYYAVCNIPHEQTYGTTVYDKGANLVHNLKGYIGDSAFYATTQKYLNEFGFKTVSTQMFIDFYSNQTGMNLKEFFDFYAYQPGFNHFSVKNIQIEKNRKQYKVSFDILQKLIEADNYATKNRIEIGFYGKNGKKHIETFTFSGKEAKRNIELDFEPEMIVADPNEKIADATIDKAIQIGTKNYTDTDDNICFAFDVEGLKDKAVIRPQLNLIRPETNGTTTYSFAGDAYWHIDGAMPKYKQCSMKFLVDEDVFHRLKDGNTIELLYKTNINEEWELIETKKYSTKFTGLSQKQVNFVVKDFKRGFYTISKRVSTH